MGDNALHQYYSARAPEYDRIYTKPERQNDLRAIEGWLAKHFAGRTTLEVACGTGYWTQFIAPEADALVSVDASAEVLEIARGRVPSGTATFVLGDAYRLPASPRAFDAAFAGFWFSHIPRARVREFLLGLHETLAPNATVVFLDNRFVAGSSTPIAQRDSEGNTYQLRSLRDGSSHQMLEDFPSEHELRGAVSGLASEVRYREWQYFWALEYVVAVP